MKYLAILLLLILISSCSSDTEYSVQPELLPYLEMFDSIAVVRKVHPNYSNLVMKLTPNLAINKHCIGLTTLIERGQRTIQFDYDFWVKSNRGVREVLALHEFGHAFLHRTHNSRLSIMNVQLANKGWPKCTTNIDCDHKVYINELFEGQNWY